MAPQQDVNPWGEMSLTSRVIVFLGIPILFGIFGFAVSYLQAINDDLHDVDVTRDFVWPWGLGMALVTVIGFRTGGFRRGLGQRPITTSNPGKTANDKKKQR